jgi:hypothetical protein
MEGSANDAEAVKVMARELFWWKTPEEALADPRRFLAQIMTLGNLRQWHLGMRVFGMDAFKDALQNAPAGVFDRRSWGYWRGVFGLPAAELPVRSLR